MEAGGSSEIGSFLKLSVKKQITTIRSKHNIFYIVGFVTIYKSTDTTTGLKINLDTLHRESYTAPFVSSLERKVLPVPSPAHFTY